MRLMILLMGVLFFTPLAHANDFLWADAESEISVSYPERWKMIHNQQPDTQLTILAPDSESMPMCRLRVRDDNRFRMYENMYEPYVQDVAYGYNFLEEYVYSEYDRAQIITTAEQVSLSRKAATFVSYAYDENTQQRTGISFLTHYFDRVIIAECTAETMSYQYWLPSFMNFINSVHFPKVYGPDITGYYRDFINRDARKR